MTENKVDPITEAAWKCAYCASGSKPWQKNGVWLHEGGVACASPPSASVRERAERATDKWLGHDGTLRIPEVERGRQRLIDVITTEFASFDAGETVMGLYECNTPAQAFNPVREKAVAEAMKRKMVAAIRTKKWKDFQMPDAIATLESVTLEGEGK